MASSNRMESAMFDAIPDDAVKPCLKAMDTRVMLLDNVEGRMNTTKNPMLDQSPGLLEDWFLQTSSEINEAVQIFVKQYESRHRVTLHDYEVMTEALIEGTYFVSGILRLNFFYRKVDDPQKYLSSAILKVPQLGAYPAHGKYMLAYEKEKFVYEILLPAMYESWPREKVVPDFYGATDSGTLALENLRETGYYQKPNGTLSGFSTCAVVLKALAQFHALSLKHISEMQPSLDSLTVVDRSNDEWPRKVYLVLLRKLRRHVLPLCSVRTRKLLDEYIKNIYPLFAAGNLPHEGGFNVIVHGQAHSYNVLLKDDQRNIPKWSKLIDFQYSRRGSPILDIMLFLVTSTKCGVVKKNCDALFRCYLDELKSILREVEPSREVAYELQDMYDDFEKYRLQFIYPLICRVPIFWAGNSGNLGLSDVEDDIDMVLKSDKYISFFKSWIKFLLYPKC